MVSLIYSANSSNRMKRTILVLVPRLSCLSEVHSGISLSFCNKKSEFLLEMFSLFLFCLLQIMLRSFLTKDFSTLCISKASKRIQKKLTIELRPAIFCYKSSNKRPEFTLIIILYSHYIRSFVRFLRQTNTGPKMLRSHSLCTIKYIYLTRKNVNVLIRNKVHMLNNLTNSFIVKSFMIVCSVFCLCETTDVLYSK